MPLEKFLEQSKRLRNRNMLYVFLRDIHLVAIGRVLEM